jgi:hypothetical protein
MSHAFRSVAMGLLDILGVFAHLLWLCQDSGGGMDPNGDR